MPATILAHTRMEPKHPSLPPEFHTAEDYEASKRYHKAKAEQERAEAIKKVPELRTLLPIDARPLMATLLASTLAERVACNDYVDEGVERWGRVAMARALCLVFAANGIDITSKTLDELAQGSEEQ